MAHFSRPTALLFPACLRTLSAHRGHLGRPSTLLSNFGDIIAGSNLPGHLYMAETSAPREMVDPGRDNDVEKESVAGTFRDQQADNAAQQRSLTRRGWVDECCNGSPDLSCD